MLLPKTNVLSIKPIIEKPVKLNCLQEQLVLTDPFRVSNFDGKGSHYQEIAIDSLNNIHVVWHDTIPYRKIMYRIYFSSNESWSKAETISINDDDVDSFYPRIFIDSNDTVHVIWREYNSTVSILYKFKSDKLWSEIINITTCSGMGNSHDIVSKNNITYFIWTHENISAYQLFFRSYSHSYQNFSSINQLTNSTYNSNDPELVIDSENKIHLVWEDKGNISSVPEVHYKVMNQTKWYPDDSYIISLDDGIRSSESAIGIDQNDHLHVVWEDFVSPRVVLYWKNSNALHSNIAKINGEFGGFHPDVFCGKETNHFIWLESSSIKYRTVTNNFEWTKIINLTEHSNLMLHPQILATNSSEIHVVWEDYELDNMWEIYHISGCFTLVPPKRQLAITLGVIFSIAIISTVGLIVLFRHKKKISINSQAK
ncbi:MAG: hypothetical protein FK733_11080 [Asgard group archaeon]|nr:hypothetical protein [Asgard group archaeon]